MTTSRHHLSIESVGSRDVTWLVRTSMSTTIEIDVSRQILISRIGYHVESFSFFRDDGDPSWRLSSQKNKDVHWLVDKDSYIHDILETVTSHQVLATIME